jgi:hypothetical protein
MAIHFMLVATLMLIWVEGSRSCDFGDHLSKVLGVRMSQLA